MTSPSGPTCRPGKTADIVRTFHRAGSFKFSCLIPGHFDAGMVGQVVVTAANAKGLC